MYVKIQRANHMARFRKGQPVWWDRDHWDTPEGVRLHKAGTIISVNTKAEEALVEFPQPTHAIHQLVPITELRERVLPG